MSALFPPTGVKEDSQYFEVSRKDIALETRTDGGYTYSRPRHARPASRVISTGFTEITETAKNAIDAFIVANGKFVIFNYTIPTSNETISVRFSALPKYKYVGVGGSHRYTITGIEMTEV